MTSINVICYVDGDTIYHVIIEYDEYGRDGFSFGNRQVANGDDREGPVLSKLGSSSTAELHPKTGEQVETKPTSMPPASVMTRLILIMVWRKLIRNPNTYSSLIGLTWSLVSFKYAKSNRPIRSISLYPFYCFRSLTIVRALYCRWGIEMPAIIAKSISILSDAGLGMAMFSLGMLVTIEIPFKISSFLHGFMEI